MQAAPEERPPLGVIFDSDMGAALDDVLALAVLEGLSRRKPPEASAASLSVSNSNLEAAAFVDAVRSFNDDIANREIPERFRRKRSLPVGMAADGALTVKPPMLTVPLERKAEDGSPLYEREIGTFTDTADPAALIRNAATAQHPDNGAVVLSGRATNVVRALSLRGAREIFAERTRLLVFALGGYPEGGPSLGVRSDVEGARKLLKDWPGPVVAVGEEVGEALRLRLSDVEAKLDWTPNHPILDALRAADAPAEGAPTTAAAAVLHAVRPDAGYFKLSEPGVIEIADDGSTRFTPQADGRHRYLIVDPAKKDEALAAYVELITAMPAARELPNFLKRRLEEEKKKKEEEERLKKEKQQAAPSGV